jgi:hypothetical protein
MLESNRNEQEAVLERITALASFNGANGAIPINTPARDAQGNHYGTANGGGTNGSGTVCELTTVPEPASLMLLSLVLSGPARLSLVARRGDGLAHPPDPGRNDRPIGQDQRRNRFGPTHSFHSSP